MSLASASPSPRTRAARFGGVHGGQPNRCLDRQPLQARLKCTSQKKEFECLHDLVEARRLDVEHVLANIAIAKPTRRRGGSALHG